MEAPERIFLHGYDFDKNPCDKWDKEPAPKKMFGHQAKYVEYIRADLAELTWEDMKKMDELLTGFNPNPREWYEEAARIFNEERQKK